MEALDDDILARIRKLEVEKSKWERIKSAALEEIKKCDQYIDDFTKKKVELTNATERCIQTTDNIDINDLSSSAIDSFCLLYDGCDTSYIENAVMVLNSIKKTSKDLADSMKSSGESFCTKIIDREEKIKKEQEKIVKDCDESISAINQELASLGG